MNRRIRGVFVALITAAVLGGCSNGGFSQLSPGAILPTNTAKPSPTASASPTASPLPTASPTPTASPSPTPGPLSVSPTSLTFTYAGQVLTFSATDPRYSGSLTAVSGNTTIGTVAPTGTAGMYSVTAIAAGGTSITVSDSLGHQALVSISISTTGGVIQSARHRAGETP